MTGRCNVITVLDGGGEWYPTFLPVICFGLLAILLMFKVDLLKTFYIPREGQTGVLILFFN